MPVLKSERYVLFTGSMEFMCEGQTAFEAFLLMRMWMTKMVNYNFGSLFRQLKIFNKLSITLKVEWWPQEGYWWLKWLESWFNSEASRAVQACEQGWNLHLDQVSVTLVTRNTMNEPSTLEDTWNCDDPVQQNKWRVTIEMEFKERNNWCVH